jgi:hypothetical protein
MPHRRGLESCVERTLHCMASGNRPAHIITVACDDHANGGCGRSITEISGSASDDVTILGPLEAQNGDRGGRQTASVPGMKVTRRRGAVVGDTTDPADRRPPELRTDLIEVRRMAHEAGQLFPDGLSFQEGVAAEIAKHQQLVAKWDPAGTSSRTGRRTFACKCRNRRQATVAQTQLNAVYRAAVAAGRHRITLDNLRRAVTR